VAEAKGKTMDCHLCGDVDDHSGCCPSGTTNCPIWPRRATLGDTMLCDVRHPHPRGIALKLGTPASVAYANNLLACKASGWRLVEIRA
jgi:hypothetical protein